MSRYDELMEEIEDIQIEILETVDELIKAKWDSNTLKSKLEKLSKQKEHLYDECDEIPVKPGPNWDKVTKETSP